MKAILILFTSSILGFAAAQGGQAGSPSSISTPPCDYESDPLCPPPSPISSPDCDIDEGRLGGTSMEDLTLPVGAVSDDCCDECSALFPRCNAWTFNEQTGECRLKEFNDEEVDDRQDWVHGLADVPSPPPPTPCTGDRCPTTPPTPRCFDHEFCVEKGDRYCANDNECYDENCCFFGDAEGGRCPEEYNDDCSVCRSHQECIEADYKYCADDGYCWDDDCCDFHDSFDRECPGSECTPPTPSDCRDVSGWKDKDGDGCKAYEDFHGYVDACDLARDHSDSHGVSAKEGCCFCDGGDYGCGETDGKLSGKGILRTEWEVDDITECCLKCAQNSYTGGCVAWSFDTRSGECILRSSRGDASPSPGWVWGDHIVDAGSTVSPPPPEECISNRHERLKSGSEIEMLDDVDQDKCCDKCRDERLCLAWSYDLENRECSLKQEVTESIEDDHFAWGEPLPPSPPSIPSPATGDCDDVRVGRTDGREIDAFSVNSQFECCNECFDIFPECVAWEYNFDDRDCVIRETIGRVSHGGDDDDWVFRAYDTEDSDFNRHPDRSDSDSDGGGSDGGGGDNDGGGGDSDGGGGDSDGGGGDSDGGGGDSDGGGGDSDGGGGDSDGGGGDGGGGCRPAACDPRAGRIEGFELEVSKSIDDADDCCELCHDSDSCLSYEYSEDAGLCILRRTLGEITNSRSFKFGKKCED